MCVLVIIIITIKLMYSVAFLYARYTQLDKMVMIMIIIIIIIANDYSSAHVSLLIKSPTITFHITQCKSPCSGLQDLYDLALYSVSVLFSYSPPCSLHFRHVGLLTISGAHQAVYLLRALVLLFPLDICPHILMACSPDTLGLSSL